jgi:hypothetical protein
MAGPAGHALGAAEGRAVDRGDHLDHLPRALLDGRVEHPIDLVAAGARMAVGAVEAETGRHDAHRADEVVHREALEGR